MTGSKFLSNGQEKKQQKRSNYANTVDGQKCADLHQNITTRTMTIQTKNLAERNKGERNVVHHTVKIETSSPQAWRGLHTRKISVEQSMKSTSASSPPRDASAPPMQASRCPRLRYPTMRTLTRMPLCRHSSPTTGNPARRSLVTSLVTGTCRALSCTERHVPGEHQLGAVESGCPVIPAAGVTCRVPDRRPTRARQCQSVRDTCQARAGGQAGATHEPGRQQRDRGKEARGRPCGLPLGCVAVMWSGSQS